MAWERNIVSRENKRGIRSEGQGSLVKKPQGKTGRPFIQRQDRDDDKRVDVDP
jgi:hypothetical protein